MQAARNEATLPVALFLVGYIFGPSRFRPQSRILREEDVFLSSFALYTIFTMACALAPTWPSLLVFRFLVGAGASAPQAVLGGMFSDLYPDLRTPWDSGDGFGLHFEHCGHLLDQSSLVFSPSANGGGCSG